MSEKYSKTFISKHCKNINIMFFIFQTVLFFLFFYYFILVILLIYYKYIFAVKKECLRYKYN